jgi:hypothetical protein
LGGQSPLEAWLSKAHHIIHLDPTVDLEEVFRHQIRRRVYGDCTFTLDGVLYEVPAALKGKIVKVRFSPWQNTRKLELVFENRSYGEARVVDTYANTRVKRERKDDPAAGLRERDPCGRPPKHPTGSPTQAAFAASKLDIPQGGNS